MGAAFFIRREVLDRIGLMDERFFIWYEEVDWCKRAKDAGLEVWYAPVAKVRHGGGQSFRQVFGPQKQRMMNRSLRYYMKKHFGLAAWAVVSVLHPLSMALAWLAPAIKNLVPRYDPFRQRRLP